MDNTVLFSEKQKFNQWWIWLLLLSINAFHFFGIYKQIISGEPFGTKPMSDTGLLISTGVTLIMTILFTRLQLETRITKEGIHVRFFPFHLSFKYYPWDDILKSYVRQYSPIWEYGGWGLRLGFFGKGSAFNVSGNMGLQLEFKNSKKLLIGTQKPDEVSQVLNKLNRNNS